jgi:undecaprenyl-diphosphatase
MANLLDNPRNPARVATMLTRLDHAELRLCVTFNRAVHRAGLRQLFRIASRLGDGPVWYALIVLLPVFAGRAALGTSLRMAIAGLVGLLIYKALKQRLVRERPFITHDVIVRAALPLDRFSFPSGHTLHAICFTVLAIDAFPLLAWVLVPLASLIALSRVVLGLHYPSDVLAGAALGVGIAYGSHFLPLA